MASHGFSGSCSAFLFSRSGKEEKLLQWCPSGYGLPLYITEQAEEVASLTL